MLPVADAEAQLPKQQEELWEYGTNLFKSPSRTYQDEELVIICFEKLIKSDTLQEGKLPSACKMIADIYMNRRPKTIQNYEKTIEMLKKSLSYSKIDNWTDCFYWLEALTTHPELYGFSQSLARSRDSIKEYSNKAKNKLCGEGLYQTALKWAQYVVVELNSHHTDDDIETFEYYVDNGIAQRWSNEIQACLYVLKGMIYQYFHRKNRENYDAAIRYYERAIAKDESPNGNINLNGKALAYFHYCDLVKSPQEYGFPISYFDSSKAQEVSQRKHYLLIEGGIQSYRHEIERLLGNQTSITKWIDYRLGRLDFGARRSDLDALFKIFDEVETSKYEDFAERCYVYTLKGWVYEHKMDKLAVDYNKAVENYILAILDYKKVKNDEKYWAVQRAFECLLPLLLNPFKFGFHNIDKNSETYKKSTTAISLLNDDFKSYHLKDNIKLALNAFLKLNSRRVVRNDDCLAQRETDLIIKCVNCETRSETFKALSTKIEELFNIKEKLIEIQQDVQKDNYYSGFISTFSRAYKTAEDISLKKINPWEGNQLPNFGKKFMDYLPLLGDDMFTLAREPTDLNKYFQETLNRRASNLWNFVTSKESLESLILDAMIDRIELKADDIQSANNDQTLRDWQNQLNIQEDVYFCGQPLEFFFGAKDAICLIHSCICKGKIFTGKPPGYHSDEYRISILANDFTADNNDSSRSFVRTLDSRRRTNSILRFLSTKQTVNTNDQNYQPEVESPVKEERKKRDNSSKEKCCSIF